MAKITASADITLLDFSVLLNLSTASPTASVTNLSTVITAANLQWVFEFYSPSGTPLYVGSFDDPDIDGVPFTTFAFPDSIQQIFGQVEYSNANKYSVKVLVKDDAGEIFDLTKGASLCKPNGNTGANNFGAANIGIKVKCEIARLYVTDSTNLVYKDITGTQVSATVELSYPKDANGNTLAPVTVNSMPALLPIKYEGEGHEIYVAYVYDYNLGDNFNVRIRYSFQEVFPIWCNVNLEPLFCEIDRITSILEKDCFDTTANRQLHQKLGLVNAKLVKATVGIVQPLSGFNVPEIVEEIKTILGITCDCCRPQGISSVGMALATDAIFSAEVSCGDMTADFSNDGNGNIVLTLANKIYTFVISDDPDNSAAFELIPTQTGCTKQTALFVDKQVLAEEVLTEIQNNPTLLNILNGITQQAMLVCSGLNGGDVLDLTVSDYSVELDTSVVGTTFKSILINGTSYPAAGGTLVTAASTIQTFLNSLAKGTFVVVYSSGTHKTTITSAANPNSISTVTTSFAGSDKIFTFNNNSGLICNILQMLLDYLNALNLVQIKSGVALTICRFNADGTVLSKSFADSVTASSIATYMADSFCNVVNYIKDKLVTCANVKALFAAFTDATPVPDGADYVLAVVNGVCQQVPIKNLGMSIFTLLSSDSDVKSIYCLGAKCTTVSDCSPVTGLSGAIADTTANYTWSAVASAIGYKYSTDGINYFNTMATSALVTGLTPATNYTFRVYPVYSNGDGIDCVITDDFTTTNDAFACDAPATLVLDNITDTGIRATWAAVTGATGYQYRVNGGGWVNAGLVLTVTLTGLTPGTDYNIEVRAIIGGTPCSETIVESATTTTTSLENITIQNDTADVTIDSILVGGVPFFLETVGASPINPGEEVIGIHSDFTGIIRVLFTTPTYAAFTMILYKNGVFVQCVDVPSDTPFHYDFSSASYLEADDILIIFATGTCS